MATSTTVTPYTTSTKLVAATDLPSWLNSYDAERLASYQLYENMYWTNPGTFKIVQRGSEENPIYLPTARIIINTINRYVAKGWDIIADPAFGTPEQRATVLLAVQDLFKKERMKSNFNSAKKYGLIRGDWAFFITADPEKPEGSRITIRPLDPASYFPITLPDDIERILGCDIIDQVVIGGKSYVIRQRYLKSAHPENGEVEGGPITYEKATLELADWEDPVKRKILRTDVPKVTLDGILNLPVYHIKNGDPEAGNPFGISEIRGLERIMAGLNQSITDEELALALEGLGMYKSAKGQPKDAAGNPTTWALGPGRVVHDESFERVSGVNTVGPFQEHLEFLQGQVDDVTGASDVAKGSVDVSVAESGIALALRMSPIISSAQDKDLVIEEVMNQFLFDLAQWMQVYEGVNFGDVRIISTFGDKLPRDKQSEFDNLMALYTADPPLIGGQYFRDRLRDLGFDIPDTQLADIIAERQVFNEALDPEAARLNQEANGASDQPVDDGSDTQA